MSRNEHSCGIIPLKRLHNVWHLLLVRHGHGHWSFPKGHKEEKETDLETATRELNEETGLDIVRLIETPPIEEHYIFTWKGERIFKKVTYFLAEVSGKVILQEVEVTDFKWLSLDEAEGFITFPEGKRLCREVQKLIRSEPNF